MSAADIFDSCVRTRGDIAGVFECDGDSAFFYLYEVEGADGAKVLDAIPICARPDFDATDVLVRWDSAELAVGLFIDGRLWAVFDERSHRKFGGGYECGGAPAIPRMVTEWFGA